MLYQELQANKYTNISVVSMQKVFTAEDDDTIRLMCGECCTLKVVAKRLSCTITEVQIRAEFLEVSLEYLNQKIAIKAKRNRPPTQEEDDIILKGCLLGWTWQKIADEMNWPRNSTIERGRRLQARAKAIEELGYDPTRQIPQTKEEEETTESERRAALPAGHPRMWAIIGGEMPNPFNTRIYTEFVPKDKKTSTELFFNKLHLCFD